MVHLKRFLLDPYPRKLKGMIDYPLDELELNNYIDGRCPEDPKKYNLIGVIIHKGSINTGHYITIS